MGLRIATNIASQSVQKNLKEVSSAGNAQLEKLSSGKRITKASDDAAGLAIATNLEAQTKGLRQATRNANDGISLVQTAEGGLNETTNILTRLRELTIQAASDTVGEVERGFLDRCSGCLPFDICEGIGIFAGNKVIGITRVPSKTDIKGRFIGMWAM